MRYYSILLSALILSLSSVNATEIKEPQSEPMVDFLLGELSIMREDYQSAGEYFDALLTHYKNNFLLERRIGIDIAADNSAGALPYLKELIKRDPSNISAWNTLAISYIDRDDLPNAIKAYDQMLKVSDQQGINGYPYIIQRLQDEKEDNATLLQVLEGVVALNPDDQRTMVVTAGVMIDSKAFKRADTLLKKAKRLNPDNAIIYEFLAIIALEAGDIEKSLTILTDAYEKYQTEELGVQYAKGLKQALRYDEALALLRKLNKPKDDVNYLLIKELAAIEYALGNYQEVKVLLNEIVGNHYFFVQTTAKLFEISQKNETQKSLTKILPNADYYEYQYDLMIHEANIALIDGDYAQFIGLFDELRYNYPQMQEQLYLRQIIMLEDLDKYELMGGLMTFAEPIITVDFLMTYMRGMLQFHSGNYAVMEEIFDAWLDEHPDDDIILNAYGYSILEYDETRAKEALKLILKANELTPGEDFIEDSIGWAYLKMGKLDLAKKYITKAYNKSKDPEMIEHYLILHDRLGSIDEVKWIYEMFKRLYPNNKHLKNLQDNYEWAD